MSRKHVDVAGYLSGRLPPEEKRRAEQHLAHCADCRQQLGARRGAEESSLGALGHFPQRLLQGALAFFQPVLKDLAVRPEPAETTEEGLQPLRVLTPRVLGGVRGTVRFIGRFGLVLLLTFAVLLLPSPPGLSAEGQRALAGFAFTAGILALEPVSLPIAALLVPVALVALGVADTHQAFETYSRPVVFLILASLFLAEALRKHGLTRRLALATIVASGGGLGALLFALMGVAAFFSMWVGSTAAAAMLIPTVLTISRQVPDREAARDLLVLLGLGLAYSTSLGGMATIMGAPANAVASGFLAQIGDWTFLDWLVYGLPSFLVLFPLTWLLLIKIVPVPIRRLDVEPAREQVRKMGPMSRIERELLLLLGGAVLLWVGGPFLEKAMGLSPTLLSAAMVAVMAVSYLAIREIIDWEDLKGVSWGIFLVIGAGLSLGEALSRNGVTDWFATLIGPLVTGLPLFFTLLLLILLSGVMTNLLNNTTIAAVFVPVLIALAQESPLFEPVQLVLPVTLATTFGYSLPSASGRMALIAATGIVERGKMIRYGLIATLFSSVTLAIFFYLLSLLGWL
jgi:sodium-dependent dicarboxylate transporter 2/3/5